MITISGTVKRSGMAIAVAAIVDTQSGINSVSPDLLQEGIHALIRGTSPKDFPQAIIVCDSLAVGMSIKLPGIRTIGIVAQSEMAFPGMDPDVPCITGVCDLIESINEGDIIIVDGTKGAVHIDPDPQTFINYQQIEEQHASRARFFIGTEHIPAKTQSGETIYCYAYVKTMEEIVRAIDAGADGLLVDLRQSELIIPSFYRDSLTSAAGKPIAFAVDKSPTDLIDAAKQFSSPGQVRILLQLSQFNELINDIETVLEDMMIEAQENPDASAVGIGFISHFDDYRETDYGNYMAIDVQDRAMTLDEMGRLGECLSRWSNEKDAQDAVIVIGNNINALNGFVGAGARCVAVSPNLVADAKYAIREIGLEDIKE